MERPDSRYHALIACSPDPVLIADAAGNVRDANPAALELLGLTHDAMPRVSASELFGAWPPATAEGWTETILWRGNGESMAVTVAVTPIPESPADDGPLVAIFLRPISLSPDAETAWSRLATIVSSSPVPIVGMTLDGEIISWNPAAEALYGYATAEAIGEPIAMLHPPETAHHLSEILERVRAGEVVSDFETTRQTRDGRRITVSLAAAPVRDADGTVVAVTTVGRDTTALREAERALHLREAALMQERDLLNAVIDQLPDAIYVKDTDSRFLRLNQATARELGIADPNEAIGKSDADFFPASLAAEYQADERRLFLTGEPMMNKAESQTEGGTGRWVLATKVPLRDPSDNVIGLVGVNRDITEQLHLQEERDRLHAELEAEIQRAAETQAQLLPSDSPHVPGYEFAGICLPARQIGGDFFDWVAGDAGVRLSLGDVMGKGIAASLLTATVRAALRSVTPLDPPDAVTTVNRALSPDLAQSDSFVTLFHAGLDPASGCLTYVDAGHGLVFIQHRDGRISRLDERGLPLGILADASYAAGTAHLAPGDTLVIYSDGLPDARPDRPLDPASVARTIRGESHAWAKLDRLVGLVRDIDALPDDLTLVLVQRQ